MARAGLNVCRLVSREGHVCVHLNICLYLGGSGGGPVGDGDMRTVICVDMRRRRGKCAVFFPLLALVPETFLYSEPCALVYNVNGPGWT